MFENAIVITPCRTIINGLSTSNLGKPDYLVALDQHAAYTRALQHAGLNVRELAPREMFPDSTFVEDVAVCTDRLAIIASPGAESRRGEVEGIRQILEGYFDFTEEIKYPATLEGGDVMMTRNRFYIGLSGRTNKEGADALTRILEKYGYHTSMVPLEKTLHLKSGVSFLDGEDLLVSGEFIKNRHFEHFNRIIVDDDESYAANSLWVNGMVLVPEGFPITREKIEKAGYHTVAINVSEFRKLDGGLSCLSLRF